MTINATFVPGMPGFKEGQHSGLHLQNFQSILF